MKRTFLFLIVFCSFLAVEADDDINALTAASKAGDIERVKSLIKLGVDPTARDDKGWFPLSIAATAGQVEVMAFLVESGSDVNERTKNKNSPILFAAGRGQLEAVKWLIGENADPNIRNTFGVSPYDGALRLKDKEVAEYLSLVADLEFGGRGARPIFETMEEDSAVEKEEVLLPGMKKKYIPSKDLRLLRRIE